jgi:flagellar FliL protein
MAKDKKEKEKDTEATEDAAVEGEEGAPKKGKKGLIIIVLVVLLLGGGGAGAYFMGFLDGLLGKHAAAEGEEAAPPAEGEHGEAAPAEGEHGEEGKDGKAHVAGAPIFYDLPEFLVNLNTGTGRGTSFLKATITLELPSEEAVKQVELMLPRIKDTMNTYLREMRTSDLAGSAGIYRLREELLLRINKTIEPQQVKDVLFKDIIVQ